MSAAPSSLPPFRIEPHFDLRVWGYRDLHPWFDRVAEDQPIGEVWLTGDQCRIGSGPQAGKRLADYFREAPIELLGEGAPECESPLLIKVLFAREKLSVQVHPDDVLAQKAGQPRGKTECWYALAAEPGAQVALGLKPGSTLEQVRQQIADGSLESSLNMVPISRGDMIFVAAGTVHSIWPGAILLETQQNCDITYRMFDYGRPRELHVEQSLESTKLQTRAGKVAPRQLADRTLLIATEYFRVERVPVNGRITSTALRGEEASPKLAYLFAATGGGRISGTEFEAIELPQHGIVAVPASSPEFVVEDRGGLELIRITPEWPEGRA